MPTSEAQKRAVANWREKHPDYAKTYRENNIEKCRQLTKNWTAANYEKQKAYARKHMAKRYLWQCASKELMNCLL